MSLLPFWAFNVVVPLLSMQNQKTLRFHQNILISSKYKNYQSFSVGETKIKKLKRIYKFYLSFNLIYLSLGKREGHNKMYNPRLIFAEKLPYNILERV